MPAAVKGSQPSAPPQSNEAEVSVLGAILQDAEAAKTITGLLQAGDFYQDRHGQIFSAARALQLRKVTPDLITVVNELQDRQELEAVGGAAYLSLLVDAVPTAANVLHHAAIVKKKADLRKIGDVCTSKAALAWSGNGADPRAIKRDLLEQLGPVESAPPDGPIRLCSVVDVLRMTRSDSERVPTRIPGLDAVLRGGIPIRRLILAGGTTAAGKTALVLQIAEAWVDAGGVVFILPYDEGAEPSCVRVGQQHGFLREQVEERLESLLAKLEGELEGKVLRFPDPTANTEPTIEDGAEAVAGLMRDRPGAPGLLIVDSIQRADTRTSSETRSERERVTMNAQTARSMAVLHNIAVLATSETNRGWYRAKREEDRSSDQAAFAEARLEYWADVALTLRARDDDSGLVDIRVPKNRLGDKTPLVLRLDRARSRFEAVEGDEGAASAAEVVKQEALQKAIDETRERILRQLKKRSGLSRSQLFEYVGGRKAVFNQALTQAGDAGMVSGEPHGRSVLYRLAEIPT